MEMTRRGFLIGSAIAAGATLIGGVSILDAEREVGKTLYFFPQQIKPATSYSDSRYFVFCDGIETESRAMQHFGKLRREVYDRDEFYKYGGKAIPVKVEYKVLPVRKKIALLDFNISRDSTWDSNNLVIL